MDLPFCKICGERHRLGHCLLWDEPPKLTSRKNAERHQEKRDSEAEEAKRSAAAENARREVQARPLTPEDMKQEEMPVARPRFDRNAYQRELMRKRRANAKN